MADEPDVKKRLRTDGLDSETTLSFKVTHSMKQQLAVTAEGIGVSNSEAIRLAVVAFITERMGQYSE